jgi:hypothetical protein
VTHQRPDCSPTLKSRPPKQIVGLQMSKLGKREQLSVREQTRTFVSARYLPDGFKMGLSHAPYPIGRCRFRLTSISSPEGGAGAEKEIWPRI